MACSSKKKNGFVSEGETKAGARAKADPEPLSSEPADGGGIVLRGSMPKGARATEADLSALVRGLSEMQVAMADRDPDAAGGMAVAILFIQSMAETGWDPDGAMRETARKCGDVSQAFARSKGSEA